MAQTESNVTAIEFEKVVPKAPILFERDNVLFGKIEKKPAIVVSARSARVPLLLRNGAVSAFYNPDGGSLPVGAGNQYDVATLTPVYMSTAIAWTHKADVVTDSREKALESSVKRDFKVAMEIMRSNADKWIQVSSTGVLATIASGGGSTTYTVSGNFGTQLITVGGKIGIYASTPTTKRGEATVVSKTATTVTVDADPTTSNTDIICPADGVAAGAVTAPSFLFGVPYHQNAAVTGYWLALNRATYPTELQTPSVNANSGSLTSSQIRLAINKIKIALGMEAVGKLIGYCHPSEQAAYEELGQIISEIIKGGSNSDGLDVFFDQSKMKMAGYPLLCSINADPTRIDFLDLSHWGRVETVPIRPYSVEGRTVFPQRDTTTGGLVAQNFSLMETAFQLYTDSPRNGSFIYGLAKPAGY